MKNSYPAWVAGAPREGKKRVSVVDKYRQTVAATVTEADRGMVGEAIDAAVAAVEPMRRMGAYERAAVLAHCVRRMTERAEELAEILCVEAGKPIRDSRGEVARLIDTFRIASEEATRMPGEVMTMDVSPRAKGYRGMWKR